MEAPENPCAPQTTALSEDTDTTTKGSWEGIPTSLQHRTGFYIFPGNQATEAGVRLQRSRNSNKVHGASFSPAESQRKHSETALLCMDYRIKSWAGESLQPEEGWVAGT